MSEATCSDPNRHAQAASLRLLPGGVAIVRGYQSFVATPTAVGVPSADAKARVLLPWLSPRHVKGRSVLDLGANAGLYSLLSVQSGARGATAVDIDETYLAIVKQMTQHLGISNLDVARGNVAEWKEPADVVLALALVHWVYSCSAVIGSLPKVVELLARLTRYLLLVEWVSPDDPAIEFFGHLDWNRERAEGPYTREVFEDALRTAFPRVEVVGDVSGTRRIYGAFSRPFELDLSGPMPLVRPSETLISSRNLVRFDGLDHWSRVYGEPGSATIVKQTSPGLAAREYALLRRLQGPYFPRAEALETAGGSSIVTIERVRGTCLEQGYGELRADAGAFVRIFGHCLGILEALQEARIVHRDIQPGNVILRSGVPVLVDFGWAVAPDMPLSGPAPLGAGGRPPDGSFCDTYSMGMLLKQVKGASHPQLDGILSLMTNPEAALRITDPALLRTLLDAVASTGEDTGEPRGRTRVSEETRPQDAEANRKLLEHAAALEGRSQALNRQLEEQEAELAAKAAAVSALSERLLELDAAAQRAPALEAELGAARGRIAALEQAGSAREAQLAAKHAEIVAMNARLTELSTELAHVHVALAETRGFVTAQTAHLESLKQELEKRFFQRLKAYLRRRLPFV